MRSETRRQADMARHCSIIMAKRRSDLSFEIKLDASSTEWRKLYVWIRRMAKRLDSDNLWMGDFSFLQKQLYDQLRAGRTKRDSVDNAMRRRFGRAIRVPPGEYGG